MSVGKICRRPARTIEREETVLEAARRMEQHGVGSLVMIHDEKPLGIVTDRDVALRVLTGELDAAATAVSEIATTPVVSLREELPVSQASDRMRTHGLRRVPVIDARGRAVGMVAADDMVRLIAEELMALADVASEQAPAGARTEAGSPGWHRGVRHYVKDVVTASPGEPVREVARRLRTADVGCAVVVDDAEAPVGMITDRDLAIRVVARGHDADATPVKEAMTPSLIRVDAGAGLQEVARVMSEHGIRRVPVVHGDRLCGMVSYDDLLVALGRELHDLGEAARGAIARQRRSG
jgi:CBS domain-containing protein